jgi:hypothetical protein
MSSDTLIFAHQLFVWLLTFLGFFIGGFLTLLLRGEFEYWIPKWCRSIVRVAAKQIPEKYRDDFIATVLGEIENTIADKRLGWALLHSTSILFNARLVLYLVSVIWLVLFTVLSG